MVHTKTIQILPPSSWERKINTLTLAFSVTCCPVNQKASAQRRQDHDLKKKLSSKVHPTLRKVPVSRALREGCLPRNASVAREVLVRLKRAEFPLPMCFVGTGGCCRCLMCLVWSMLFMHPRRLFGTPKNHGSCGFGIMTPWSLQVLVLHTSEPSRASFAPELRGSERVSSPRCLRFGL